MEAHCTNNYSDLSNAPFDAFEEERLKIMFAKAIRPLSTHLHHYQLTTAII